MVRAFVCVFADEEAHGDAHPEELGGFDAAVTAMSFVDDQVAIVERLDAEEIEIHIGGWIDGVSKGVEIIAQKFRRQTLNANSRAEVALESLAVRIAEALDAIALDFPIKDFLVDIREHDAGREFCEIRITLDERAGVENDRVFQDVLGHLGGKRAAKLALDLEGVEVQVESDHCKLNSLPEFGSIPENALAIALNDHDERLLHVVNLGLGFGFDDFLAVAGTLGTVEDVALGNLVVALAHQFLLHEILHILDVDEGGIAGADAVADATGNRGGRLGIFLHGKEGTAAGRFNLGLHPRNHRTIATNQANIHRLGLHGERGSVSGADRALENETLCDIVCVVFDKRLLDEEREVMLGEAQRATLLGLLREAQSHGVGHIRNEAAVLLVENIFLLARQEQVGESSSDFIGDIREVERLFVAIGAGHYDSRERVRRGGDGFAPGEVGLLVARHGDEALQRDVFVE